LTIQGERQFTSESSDQQFHRVERRYGAFRRSITLPGSGGTAAMMSVKRRARGCCWRVAHWSR
jgi:hypothetical protein